MKIHPFTKSVQNGEATSTLTGSSLPPSPELSDDRAPRSARIGREVWRNPSPAFGVVVLLGMIVLAVFAPLIAPHDPEGTSLSARLLPPVWGDGGSWRYPLGTDGLGRDTLSRIIFGTRISLLIGLAATVLETIVGTVLGMLAGYYGGWVDSTIMRMADVLWSFPYIVLGIAIIAIYGPSTFVIIFVLALTGWIRTARVVRGSVKGLMTQDYVVAAIGATAHARWIMRRHLLPNVMPSILVLSTFSVAGNILGEATLSFLGLGVQPPTPTWGGMLSQSREYMLTSPWLTAAPGIALMLVVLGINQLGDGLRDVLDPHLRGRL